MEKVSKRELIKKMAKDNNMSVAKATRCYDLVIGEIIDTIIENKQVNLSGFGNFYLQKHKGHPVQFESADQKVDDYVVFKFTASDTLNQQIRKVCDPNLVPSGKYSKMNTNSKRI